MKIIEKRFNMSDKRFNQLKQAIVSMEEKATKLINMVLKTEGFYNPGMDSGGETYRGITRVYNPKWEGWAIIDKHKPLKKYQEIKDEALNQLVNDFYYKTFYLPMKIDKINSLCISGHLFDQGINSGSSTGVKILQKAINNTYGVNIDVDGKIGEQTLKYANGNKTNELEQEFINQRIAFYKNVVTKKPSQERFLNVWLKRVKDTTSECSK